MYKTNKLFLNISIVMRLSYIPISLHNYFCPVEIVKLSLSLSKYKCFTEIICTYTYF